MSETKFKTREFSIEFLRGVLWGETEGTKVVKDRIDSHSRWSVHHELVFEYEDKLYGTYYSVGATESQDETPWDYENDPVTVTEVQGVEVTVIQYKGIPLEQEEWVRHLRYQKYLEQKETSR